MTILTEDEKDNGALGIANLEDRTVTDEQDILGSMEREINLKTGQSSMTSLHHNTPKEVTTRVKALIMHEDHNNDSTTRHLRDFSFKNP